MAISNELNTLKTNILSAYNTIQTKGGTIPTNKNTQNLSNAINTIPSGGGIDDYFGSISPKASSNTTILYYMTKIPDLQGTPKSLEQLFYDAQNVTEIGNIDTSKASSFHQTFFNCRALKSVKQYNTSFASHFSQCWYNCYALTTIPELNFNNANSINRIVYACSSLKDLGGFLNLGQNYDTTLPVNYSAYTLDLSASSKLTHDSLMNVINKLYDIKTKGCKAQKLTLGVDNKAKLTAEEIAIATNKGWTVS